MPKFNFGADSEKKLHIRCPLHNQCFNCSDRSPIILWLEAHWEFYHRTGFWASYSHFGLKQVPNDQSSSVRSINELWNEFEFSTYEACWKYKANHGSKRYGVLKSADWTRADCKDGLTDLLVALSLTRAVTMVNSLWCSEANVWPDLTVCRDLLKPGYEMHSELGFDLFSSWIGKGAINCWVLAVIVV